MYSDLGTLSGTSRERAVISRSLCVITIAISRSFDLRDPHEQSQPMLAEAIEALSSRTPNLAG